MGIKKYYEKKNFNNMEVKVLRYSESLNFNKGSQN